MGRRIGLTGGIACGKSTASAMLKARGAAIIDADEVARDVVAPGTAGLTAITEAFGPAILREGALDRAALARIIYATPAARAQLEAILHPRIAEESARRMAEAARVAPLVVYDAALIIESGRAESLRPLVVVYAPRAVQMARLMARDGLDEAAAAARLAAQMPIDEKARYADHIIDNSGDLAQTQAQIDQLWRLWLEHA
ncbi:dephospho-CoA kinase [Myxococcota bacterium]|nr:dephospho-CoA kinase [Myxococcota bacterium]MBU1429884.1 dephospho-CoA kinase [Myxococcota bacterium]MBU1897389.1 dephospho-CoA kinase [Myxococcota bacterium]